MEVKKVNGGFTLSETLAVMAIIALLAALVFPVGQRSIGAAQKSVCLGHLYQIGIATGIYLADNNDTYPEVVNYYTRYAKGLSFGRPRGLNPANYESPRQALQSYVKSPDVFRCPDDAGTEWAGGKYKFFPALWNWNDGSSYVFSEFFEHQTSTSLKSPSDSSWACDGNSNWHDSQPDDQAIAPKVNFLMFDGHVFFGNGNAPYVPIEQLYPESSTP